LGRRLEMADGRSKMGGKLRLAGARFVVL